MCVQRKVENLKRIPSLNGSVKKVGVVLNKEDIALTVLCWFCLVLSLFLLLLISIRAVG